MARYIITEKQERLLREINVAWGKFAVKPVVYFYRDIINNVPSKKRKKLFQSAVLTKQFTYDTLRVVINNAKE